ncbi:MAG: succinate dehydrogenase, cytochrome b556 subunit [Holosporaceae bacterium]|jgi:succinate dehydrogenase / fumarate reductase cytochrome b subunit|nr:succinate dehydrogenase, cytochrome b556 subunit [Rhodospirillaceae bacterium]
MRPLSPHLQIYRPQITSVLSILHRITGFALSIGLLLLAGLVISAAFGQQSFDLVRGQMSTWYGYILLMGWSWAFYYHLCNGIRHLFWDIGKGFELSTVTTSGWAVLLASLTMTVVTWVYVVQRSSIVSELLSHANVQ